MWSRRPHSKAKSGKPGFPFEEYEEHDRLEDGCKFTTCYKNLSFHAKSSKHGPGYPYKKVMQEQTQKHGFGSKLSDQKRDFLQEHMNTIFLFQNHLQIDA